MMVARLGLKSSVQSYPSSSITISEYHINIFEASVQSNQYALHVSFFLFFRISFSKLNSWSLKWWKPQARTRSFLRFLGAHGFRIQSANMSDVGFLLNKPVFNAPFPFPQYITDWICGCHSVSCKFDVYFWKMCAKSDDFCTNGFGRSFVSNISTNHVIWSNLCTLMDDYIIYIIICNEICYKLISTLWHLLVDTYQIYIHSQTEDGTLKLQQIRVPRLSNQIFTKCVCHVLK